MGIARTYIQDSESKLIVIFCGKVKSWVCGRKPGRRTMVGEKEDAEHSCLLPRRQASGPQHEQDRNIERAAPEVTYNIFVERNVRLAWLHYS